jgi:hypothetical protein
LLSNIAVWSDPVRYVNSFIIPINPKFLNKSSRSFLLFTTKGFSVNECNYLFSIGFYELLEGVAQICERECGLLPANVSPDCAIQLTYVAQVSYHSRSNPV